MKVRLQNLYKHEGNEIKENMRKGERVVIDFDNTVALGASTIEDLKEFVDLPNVEFMNLADCVRDQLGIESADVSQLSLFDAG